MQDLSEETVDRLKDIASLLPRLAQLAEKADVLVETSVKVEALVADVNAMKAELAKEKEERALEAAEFRSRIQALEATTKGLGSKTVVLEARAVKQEGQDRRSNLIVRGIGVTKEELEGHGDERDLHTLELVRNACRQQGMKSEWKVERCHRLGRVVNGMVPIIIKLSFYQDKVQLLRERTKLRGTRIYLDEDFPREIREKRWALRRFASMTNKEGARVDIRFPFEWAWVGNQKVTVDEARKMLSDGPPRPEPMEVSDSHKRGRESMSPQSQAEQGRREKKGRGEGEEAPTRGAQQWEGRLKHKGRTASASPVRRTSAATPPITQYFSRPLSQK